MKALLASLIFGVTFSLLTSCGDSYNSHLLQGQTKITSNAGECKSGCFGIPQDWYDRGIIVKPNGEIIPKPDASVKIQGECYFKVCKNDTNNPYTKDALDWVSEYGGGIIDQTDPLKCANLNSVMAEPKLFEAIEVNAEPGC